MPAEGNVGIAFALVIGAGLSTTIGASAAFFAKLASTKTLAVGLALSAGVMMYVSFVEIFMQKGVAKLDSGGWGTVAAYRYGTLMFFGGMVVTALLDVVVHIVSNLAGVNQEHDPNKITEIPACRSTSLPAASPKSAPLSRVSVAALEAGKGPGPGSVTSIIGSDGEPCGSSCCPATQCATDIDGPVHLAHKPEDMPDEAAQVVDEYVTADHHRFGLQKMGLMTALAIGIHNLPEGLATFVAALADPLNGVAIAVAIALHNIPEGVCVAMPVYYATGSRWKGFMWAFISGISEPIGGLLGYLILYGNRMNDVAYGILFCIVGGMMVYISVKELIPTALKYDPDNKVTSTCVIVGMFVMAASLLMFTI